MKSFRLTGINKMELITVPDPQILSETDVLIRMKTVGVCGSDIHYYKTGQIGSQIVEYPFTIGHEGAGVVEKVGGKVSRIKPGNIVAIDPAMPCYECDQCINERTHTCRKLRFLGNPGQAEGCLSEFIEMPEKSLFPVSDSVGFDGAALSEPLSIGYYAVAQSNLQKGSKTAILGFGPIGMSVLKAAQYFGSGPIYVTDKINERLGLAKANNATWTAHPIKTEICEEIKKIEPQLLDIVFECCGQQEAIDQAIEILKPGGKLMIIGIPEFDRWTFSVDKLRHKEITIVNVRRQNEYVQPVLDLLDKGSLQAGDMITHRFPFSETQKAFELVSEYRDGVMKAMIDF